MYISPRIPVADNVEERRMDLTEKMLRRKTSMAFLRVGKTVALYCSYFPDNGFLSGVERRGITWILHVFNVVQFELRKCYLLTVLSQILKQQL